MLDRVSEQREQAQRQYSLRLDTSPDPYPHLMWFCPDCTSPTVLDQRCVKCNRDLYAMCADNNCQQVLSTSLATFAVDHASCLRGGHKIVSGMDQGPTTNFNPRFSPELVQERLIHTTPARLSKAEKRKNSEPDTRSRKKRRESRAELISCSFNDQTELVMAARKGMRELEAKLNLLRSPSPEILKDIPMEDLERFLGELNAGIKEIQKSRDAKLAQELRKQWEKEHEIEQQQQLLQSQVRVGAQARAMQAQADAFRAHPEMLAPFLGISPLPTPSPEPTSAPEETGEEEGTCVIC